MTGTAWRYEIKYGPEGEANYAWVYDDKNDMVCTTKTHHAKAIVDRMNTRATPPAPTPSGGRERIARVIDPYAWIDLDDMTPTERFVREKQLPRLRDEALAKADAILALLPDAAAIRAAAFEEAAKIAHDFFLEQPARNNHVLAKMQAGLEIASAISGGDLERHARPPLKPDDVEWVVNDIAELGVKIGEQFFFLYKGRSLVYGADEISSVNGVALNEDADPPTQHMWRLLFKREFGECAHPINYTDPTKIGTVSLDDSDDWKPLPAAIRAAGEK